MKDDGGSASVLVLGAAALMLTVSVPVVLTASLLSAHRQAVRAADLAALAGAQHSLQDAGTACAWAERVAEANGGRLRGCALAKGVLEVEVVVRSSIELLPETSARSRAGQR